jgi:hypothetical protein
VLEPYRGPRVIECPLCGLLHRADAVACDRCGHRLGERPDLAALRAEYRRRKRARLVAAACIAAMLGLNFALFRGTVIIIVVAPLGWFGWNEVRLRYVRRALDRAAQRRDLVEVEAAAEVERSLDRIEPR